jgi:hypothetical protein
MRKLTLVLIVIAFVVYTAVFGREGVPAVITFMPFTMTPLAVSAYLAWRWRSVGSQAILLLTTLGYFAWFIYLYVEAMIVHLDPQSPIAFLFVAIYAAPIMIVMWLIAYAIEWEYCDA